MKCLLFVMNDLAKTAAVAQASDKVWASPPLGMKLLAHYVCQGLPFPGAPPNTLIGVSVVEVESNEAIAAVTWPIELAGATIWVVPVLEVSIPGAAEVEKKLRG